MFMLLFRDQKSRCKFGDLIVMKQIYCSLDNSDTDVTYAAVSRYMFDFNLHTLFLISYHLRVL